MLWGGRQRGEWEAGPPPRCPPPPPPPPVLPPSPAANSRTSSGRWSSSSLQGGTQGFGAVFVWFPAMENGNYFFFFKDELRCFCEICRGLWGGRVSPEEAPQQQPDGWSGPQVPLAAQAEHGLRGAGVCYRGRGGGRPAQEPRNPPSTAGRRPELHTHGGGCTPVGACTSSTHASHPFPSTWSGRGGDCGDAILAAPAAARHHGNCGEGGGAVCGGSWRSAPGTAPGGAGHAGSRHPPTPTPPPPPSPACARAHRHPPGLRAPPVCAHGHGCACAYKRPACTHSHTSRTHTHTRTAPPPPPAVPVPGSRDTAPVPRSRCSRRYPVPL